jgi:hypothetical protein
VIGRGQPHGKPVKLRSTAAVLQQRARSDVAVETATSPGVDRASSFYMYGESSGWGSAARARRADAGVAVAGGLITAWHRRGTRRIAKINGAEQRPS